MKKFLLITGGVIFLLVHLLSNRMEFIPANRKTDEKTLVIYTARTDNLLDATIPLFEEKYGIQVEIVKDELGVLLSHIREDGEHPSADIVMGGTYSYMYANSDLFQEYVSVNDKYTLEQYRNTTKLTTSYVLDGCCLIVNKSLSQGIFIKSYHDLLDERLKGNIVVGNPLNSSYAFSQLTNTLLAMGGYEDDAAWEYVERLMGQVGEIASTWEKVYTSVASGKYMVGLTYESPCVTLLKDSADIEIIYPAEGTVYSPDTITIVRNCEHLEYAKHFVDFVTSRDMQNIYSDILMKRSVYADAIESKYLVPIQKIHLIEEDIEYIKAHKMEILRRYSLILEEIVEK